MLILLLNKLLNKKYWFSVIFLQLFIANIIGPSVKEDNLSTRIIRTKYGDIRGTLTYLDSKFLDPVEVYKGIPYASPPIGHLRFMPPVTAALWSNVRVANKFAPVCPQRLPDISNETQTLKRIPRGRYEYLKRLLPYLQNQSEDCLYLNIYAPLQDVNNSKRYPVIVFVHGESFEWNSGNPYDGTVLASYGKAVVVTVNYRLGILGFLNANTDLHSKSPANYGLMDQVAALHWLQENIATFGGDPRNVTIIGHGTGAACVHFLMTSIAVPEGLLFHRAVLMSGSGLSPWALVREPARNAALVAVYANCSLESTNNELLQCLRERSVKTLLKAQNHVQGARFFYAFGPSVDGVVIDTDEWDLEQNDVKNDKERSPQHYEIYDYGTGTIQLRKRTERNFQTSASDQLHTLNLVHVRKSAIAKLARYDLMLGAVKAEAYFDFNAHDIQYGIEAERRAKILKTFVRNTYNYHLSEILATIVNEYTEWERPVQHPINIRDETLEALSDAKVIAPIVQTADLHSTSHKNSYFYIFDYQTKFGDYPQRQGCVHGEDLPYLFGAPLVGGLSHFTKNFTKAEILLSETVMIYWSNFARTGNPNDAIGLSETEMSATNNNYDSGYFNKIDSTIFSKNKIRNLEWIPYESVHKRYLNLDTKSKLKNHFRAHRLSFWLNLVPDLHKPGGDNVPRSHHEFPNNNFDFDDNDYRNDDKLYLKFFPTLATPRLLNLTTINTITLFSTLILLSNNNSNNFSLSTIKPTSLSNNQQQQQHQYQEQLASSKSSIAIENTQHSLSSFEDGFATYSTALIITIAIGCSLLLLNLLIFAGIYYKRDKHYTMKKRTNQNGQMPNSISGDLESSTSSLGPNINISNVGVLKNTPTILTDHQQRPHMFHEHNTSPHHQYYHRHVQYTEHMPISGLATLPRVSPPPLSSSMTTSTMKRVQISCEQQPLLLNQNNKDAVILSTLKSALKTPIINKSFDSMQDLKV